MDWSGYNAAFLFLAGCAALALLVLWQAVPETHGWPHRPASARERGLGAASLG